MSPALTRMPSLPPPRRAKEFSRLLDAGLGTADATLAPMLTVAHGLQSLPANGAPSVEFRAALRKRLVAVAGVQAQAASPTETTPRPTAQSGWHGRRGQRRIAIASGTLAALVAVAGVAVGASRSLPGDPLYGVKRSTEAAQLLITTGDEDRGRKHLEFARTRLQEISDLLKPGSALGGDSLGQPLAAGPVTGSLIGPVTDALHDMDGDTVAGSRDLTRAFRDQHDRNALLTLRTFATDQRRQLAALLPAFPTATQPRAELSLTLLTAVHERAQELLDSGPCTGACAQATAGHTGEDRLGVLPADQSTFGQQQPGNAGPSPTPTATPSSGPGIVRHIEIVRRRSHGQRRAGAELSDERILQASGRAIARAAIAAAAPICVDSHSSPRNSCGALATRSITFVADHERLRTVSATVTCIPVL